MRRPQLVGAAAALIGGLCAGPALAADTEPAVTGHARALNATWLADAPPPPSPGAVCLIDSGVSATPDTTGPVTERLSLAPGDGTDGSPVGHGTTIASIIAAPRNGWGTVGIWPQAQIVSVRADSTRGGPGSATIWGDYAAAIEVCLKRPAVRVISLSVAGVGYRADLPVLIDQIGRARDAGVSVVAAAGNGAGAVETPGSLPGVVAVAALGADGTALCAFSARAVGVLAAPGCDLLAPVADGRLLLWDGTSFAAPQVAALLAALRAYRPELTVEAAEQLLSATAQPGPDGVRRVDAAAAFRAAGLERLVHDPPPIPPPPAPPAPEVIVVPRPPRPALPRPRLLGRVRSSRIELILRFAPVPVGSNVTAFGAPLVEYLRGRRTIAVTLTGRRQWLVLRTSTWWGESAALRLRIPAASERTPPPRRGRR